MIRALIFDFNGVIVESTDTNAQLYARIFAGYGQAVADKVVEHYKKVGGIPRQRRIAMYLRDFAGVEPSEDLVQDMSAEFSRLYLQSLRDAQFVPGAKEFISTQGQKYEKFLSSGAPEVDIPRMLEILGLKQYFIRGFGAPRSKGEHIAFILNEFGYSASEVVFIGDSPKDRDAAKGNDIWFIARDRGLASLQNEPFRVKDLSELPEAIRSIEIFSPER